MLELWPSVQLKKLSGQVSQNVTSTFFLATWTLIFIEMDINMIFTKMFVVLGYIVLWLHCLLRILTLGLSVSNGDLCVSLACLVKFDVLTADNFGQFGITLVSLKFGKGMLEHHKVPPNLKNDICLTKLSRIIEWFCQILPEYPSLNLGAICHWLKSLFKTWQLNLAIIFDSKVQRNRTLKNFYILSRTSFKRINLFNIFNWKLAKKFPAKVILIKSLGL